MAEVTPDKICDSILEKFNQIIGQNCSRQHIGYDRSLFLGFGEVNLVKSVIGEGYHAEWEIGTYSCSWRVMREKQIVCGSQDAVDSIDELRQTFNEIELGKCSSIRHLTDFDVRVEFDNNISVDILGTISDGDEVLHIFCPEKIVIAFSIVDGWALGRSDMPWK